MNLFKWITSIYLDMWDLLFGYVVYEFPFMRSDDPGEEVPGEKVDANVGRRVGQRSVLISHLGGFVGDLRVLHHLVFARSGH